MYKKNINRIIWMILIVIIINLTITSKEVIGETIYVDDNGSADYSNIQNAIDNASEEDTVFVKNGKYYENIIIDKSITMLGESKENTIIISGIFKTAVEITADNVAISEFTIQNGSPGIKVYNSSYVFITKNNVFSVNGDGISLLISDCNEVSDNEVKQCHGNNGGIDVRGSSHNKIMNNKVTLTIYGDGIHLHMADDNLISNNIVNNNKDNGFEIHNSNNNILKIIIQLCVIV